MAMTGGGSMDIARALAFWSIVGVLFALPAISQDAQTSLPLWRSLAEWWSWGVLAPLIVEIDRALPFGERDHSKRLAAHLAMGPVLTGAAVYLSTMLSAVLGVGPWRALWDWRVIVASLHGGFVWEFLVYVLIVGVAQANLNRQRYLSSQLRIERLQRNFTDARLNALRMQLDPHFLFNALNTISSQVTRDGKLARAMIEHLADLLRLSLDERSRHEVRLDEELSLLDHYLAIQRIRFEGRLRVVLDVEADVAAAFVPSLLMQPLVENAIRHGIAPRIAGGTVTVSARRDGTRLRIRVLDDGVGLPKDGSFATRQGVGLSVTRERVERFDPDGTGRLAVLRRPEGGTEIALCLPLRIDHAHAAA